MFTHSLFLPFLLVTAIIYWNLHKQILRTGFLTLCSLAALWYFDPRAVLVVIILTVLTYLCSGWIESNRPSKLAYRTGIIGLLLVFAVFKYLGLLTVTLNSLTSFADFLPALHFEKLFLPIGISYITFKYLSYITDVQAGVLQKGTWLDFACYGSMFTIFTAGPIERFEVLKPQFETEIGKFKSEYLDTALERILFGMFKKLVIADWMALYIMPVWQNPDLYTLASRILVLLGYSMYIYFDFSGYSDIAIGSSRLFGYKIGENFNFPYLATNLSQFWRRWHISLSNWIRTYLFFPLSQGSKNRFWKLFCVPVIAMAICGIWHGSAWHFAIWGIWHGLGIAVFQLWSSSRHKRKEKIKINSISWVDLPGIFITFSFVTLGWLFFGVRKLKDLTDFFTPSAAKSISIRGGLLILCLVILLFAYLPVKDFLKTRLTRRQYIAVRWIIIFLLIWFVITFHAESSPFQYAGF